MSKVREITKSAHIMIMVMNVRVRFPISKTGRVVEEKDGGIGGGKDALVKSMYFL